MKKLPFLILLIPLVVLAQPGSDQDAVTRGRELHRDIFTLDTHCDTPLRMQRGGWDVGEYHDPTSRFSGKIDLPRMQNGNLDAEFFALFVAQKDCNPENYRNAFEKANQLLFKVQEMCQKYPGMIALTQTPEKAYENEKEGLLSAFMGIENGFALGHDLKHISYFFDRGVRYITLCHTRNNDICDSSTDGKGPEHDGLSEFGRQVVTEMNRLGMLVDVSHISDTSFYQVLDHSRAPVFASHSCCRALCNHPRNLSDEMIKALAAKGGVLQICFFSDYLRTPPPDPEREKALKALYTQYGPWDKMTDQDKRRQFRTEFMEIDSRYPRPLATVKDIVDHIEHVIKLVGIDYVGIGTDFDGGGGVTDCYDVSQMPNITLELLRRGYSNKDIEKIWGGNFMRVFRSATRTAQEWRI
ncbi:dipeptidase [candidate division KSB1 bacterium]|nr:dipeptidase [candidate division KSB1 bacterium]